MTPDQVQSLAEIILAVVLSGLGAGVVTRVTTSAQDRNYKTMFQDAIERSFELSQQVDALTKTVAEQKVLIDGQNVAALVTADKLKTLAEDRAALSEKRDADMRQWGIMEAQLAATKDGQQTAEDRIRNLEKQVEDLTAALKIANADLERLKTSYEKLASEKQQADRTIASLEDQLKADSPAAH